MATFGGFSYGIYTNTGNVIINGGIVTAKGETKALKNGSGENYTVPEGYKFWIATDTDNTTGTVSGTSTGSSTINSYYKYAKIEAATNYTLYLNDADGKLLKGYGGADVTVEMALAGAVVTATNGDAQAPWTLSLTNFEFETTAGAVLEVPGGTTIVLAAASAVTPGKRFAAHHEYRKSVSKFFWKGKSSLYFLSFILKGKRSL